MAEESIILISKDYANSNLIERGEYTVLENKVDRKQDELTAGTGINLNDNTISVDTATVVGTSNLPVTASAVNTKLGDYVNEIQAEDDSITVTKTGSSVTLKANGGGSIDENRVITGRYESYGYGSNRFIADSKVDAIRLTQNDVRTDIGIGSIKLHNEDGPVNADFTVQTMVSSFCPSATISIPCDEDGGYTAITSNGGTEVMRFQHDTSAGYDTHNTKIYFNTPVYDKDGNEITGGGGSDRVTTDANGRTLILGRSGELAIGTDGEFEGELGSPMIYANETGILYIGGVDNFINFYQNAYGPGANIIRIKIGTEELELDQAKLQKLKQLLES